MDGGGIDVWIGELSERKISGVLATIDLDKKDIEIKILLGCTPENIQAILQFSNQGRMRALYYPAEMSNFATIRERQSIRRFLSIPVSTALITEVLEAATLAPSAHNRQPWRFVVIQSLDVKKELAKRMGTAFRHDLIADGLSETEINKQVERSNNRIEQAPAIILFCLDTTVGDAYPDKKRQKAEWIMGTQSLAMAGQNLLLAAHTKGLGAVWMCAPLFAQDVVRQTLQIPTEWEPQGMVLLGYPAKIPPRRSRRPITEIARYL